MSDTEPLVLWFSDRPHNLSLGKSVLFYRWSWSLCWPSDFVLINSLWDYDTFNLRKLFLQMHIPSHPVGLDVWFFVGPFVVFHTTCVLTAEALARLRERAGSPEPSLVAYMMSTIISWASSFLWFHALATEAVSLHWCTPWRVFHCIQVSLVTRKPVFGICDQGRLKPVCTVAEAR